jgi:3D (Asp-Asp-Asp) domain-containing protein
MNETQEAAERLNAENEKEISRLEEEKRKVSEELEEERQRLEALEESNVKLQNTIKMLYPDYNNGYKSDIPPTISEPFNPEWELSGNFVSTAYSMQGLEVWGGHTMSGVLVSALTTIAVDTKVIPLGSIVWVDGIGLCIAADVGGSIKGKKIDIYIPDTSVCFVWGVRNVDVYMVKRGDGKVASNYREILAGSLVQY